MLGGGPGRSAYADYGTVRASRLVARDMVFYVIISGIGVIWIAFAVTLGANVDDPATPEDESLTGDALSSLALLFIAMTVVHLVFAFRRCRTWAVLVRDGVEVPGKVTRITTVPQGALVDVSYLFEGREVPNKKMVGGLIPRIGMRLSEGQEVTVLVDGSRPERYIILDLYVRPRT